MPPEPRIRLVVNADDFGATPAISRGVIEAHRRGIVTSTSLLGNAPDLEATRALLPDAPALGLGVHLALTGFRPVLPPDKVPSLVGADGRFPGSWREVALRWARGLLSQDEIERELDTQVARARDAGLKLDHLDTHQHLGFLPGVARAVRMVARRHGISGLRQTVDPPAIDWLVEPRRALEAATLGALGWFVRRELGALRHAPQTWGFVESGQLDDIRILEIIGRLGPGDHELICHPGASNEGSADDPGWRYGWTRELAALCSPRIKAALADRGVALVRWSDFAMAG